MTPLLSLRSAGLLLRRSADDHRLLAAAYVSLLATDVALRAIGFKRLMARIQPARDGIPVRSAALRRAYRYAAMLEQASRYHFVRARCLHRSLALHHWLRRKGLASELRIGVRRDGGQLLAHAWVEVDGRVINDRPESVAVFAPLKGLSSLGALRFTEDVRRHTGPIRGSAA
jgi:hypothetical protein